MASLNVVFLIGNLVRDPELRYVPSGDAVANLRIAVNRTYTTREGEKKEETCFLTVVVWRKQADTCGEYLSKGSSILVEGRLQSRNWETSNGEKRSALEVVARRIQFVTRKSGRASGEAGVSHGERDLGTGPIAEEEISQEAKEIGKAENERNQENS